MLTSAVLLTPAVNFFQENAKNVVAAAKTPADRKLKVLDIACNDGSQLDCYDQSKVETWGVDPAENLAPMSKAKGHNIIVDFWNEKVAANVPQMDIITAQNVFAHTAVVDDFLRACKLVMHDDSDLYIQTSQSKMILNGEFDTLYHEHLSFFSVSSMKTLVERLGLHLHNVEFHSIHGISFIFHIKKAPVAGFQSSVQKLLDEEKANNLHEIKGYQIFAERALRTVAVTQKAVDAFRADGYGIVGFGAAAKGMTFLGVSGLKLDYCIDENPLKIGKKTPPGGFPVQGPNHLKDDKREKLLVVVLAWNFGDEIERKAKQLRGGNGNDVMLRYFPRAQLG